jgi:hypothetical protein
MSGPETARSEPPSRGLVCVLSLATRLPLGAVVALGMVVMSPALWSGWVADDYLHQLFTRDEPGIAGLRHRPLDLFRFADGDPDTARQLMEAGIFPWWADPRAKLAFFRPLASATHWLDYALWPGSPWLMHLQSLLWYGALLGVVALVFRRLSSSLSTAGLSLLLFAVDDAHAPVVGWLANRNMIVALTLGLPALVLHDSWRRSGERRFAWLAHIALLAGLGAGEAASIVLPYLLSYALFLDSGTWRARAASLLGYLLILVSWRLLYDRLGYGVLGSGLYADPGRSPWFFLQQAASRAPVLALSLVALPWADFWELYPFVHELLKPAVLLSSVGVLAALGAVLRPVLRERAAARFWLVGAALSILPVCASFPHDRLLLGPSVGAMGLLAELLLSATPGQETVLRRLAPPALVVLHLLFAPGLALLRSQGTGQLDAVLRAADQSVPVDASIASESWILLNPPLDPFAAYFSPYREVHLEPRPARLYWLATGVSALRVTGLDSSTLLLRPTGGYLSSSSQRMLRSTSQPFRRGERVQLDDVSFEVTELTTDGRPAEVRVHFAKGLSHPSLRWLKWRGPGYEAFTPPAPGDSVVVPAVDLLAALSG